MKTYKPVDAIVIGAGFSGLYQLYCLREKLSLRAHVLEAGSGVGGTWYWNRYPGARCDSESHSYCYYFSDEILQEWSWTERYPGHAEIERYLNFVTDRLQLRKDITLDTRVSALTFEQDTNRWTVETNDGNQYDAKYVITAVGCLSSVNLPKVPGIEKFSGTSFHTGKWPKTGVDFRAKHVGLIGTGSTGIQTIPEIAETAASLTVFQRTPNFSIPARNHPLTESFKAQVKKDAQMIHQDMLASRHGHPWQAQKRSAKATPRAERQEIYEAAWQRGGLRFRESFDDVIVDLASNETAASFIKDKIRSVVTDPETAEMLTKFDHPFGTKRPPIDSHYFETFNRDNVHLVDVRATPITEVIEAGIKTEAATFHFDCLVFATGFDAMTGSLNKIDIKGRGRMRLAAYWKFGPKTNLGMQIPNFPNLFVVTGPGSPSVLTNMPRSIEQNVEWITDCIGHLENKGVETIEATEESAEKWTAHVTEVANATLLPMAGHSWYLGANVPGKPRVFMPYAGGLDRYRKLCTEVAEQGYPGFILRTSK